MTQIIRLDGIDKKLYPLIGPLVMNPEVLHFNNNYPFKTGEQYKWYIAVSQKEVLGFIPVEYRKQEWIINNYYACLDKENEILSTLVKAVIKEWEQESSISLSAVVQTRHLTIFTEEDFEITKNWKIYCKMKKQI